MALPSSGPLVSRSPRARASEFSVPHFQLFDGRKLNRKREEGGDCAAAAVRNGHFSSSICRTHRRALSSSHSSLAPVHGRPKGWKGRGEPRAGVSCGWVATAAAGGAW